MFVEGVPSTSAFNFIYPFSSDMIRKSIIFIFTISSVVPDGVMKTQITIAGIAISCIALASNLGSRAWNNLKLNSIPYDGIGTSLICYICSVIVGLAVPYLGYHEIQAGGKVASEVVLKSIFFVGMCFI